MDCGCAATCTTAALSRSATDDTSAHSCGTRMAWLIVEMGLSEIDACRRVANEFPDDCGACQPDTCTAASLDCGCPATCSDAVLDQVAGPEFDGNHTCRARIGYLMNAQGQNATAACTQVSAEFPDVCGAGCDPGSCDATEPLALQDDEGVTNSARDFMSTTSGTSSIFLSSPVLAVAMAAAMLS